MEDFVIDILKALRLGLIIIAVIVLLFGLSNDFTYIFTLEQIIKMVLFWILLSAAIFATDILDN